MHKASDKLIVSRFKLTFMDSWLCPIIRRLPVPKCTCPSTLVGFSIIRKRWACLSILP